MSVGGSRLSDAQILYAHERWARAFALAVLAQEEAGKALLAIAEQIPGNDVADLKPRRHEDKLTAVAITEIAFLGDLADIEARARQVDGAALHREKLSALYVDAGPHCLQSPASFTRDRAEEGLNRARELVSWTTAHLGEITPESIVAAIELTNTLMPAMEKFTQDHGAEAGLGLARQIVEWSLAQARRDVSRAGET